MKKWRLLDTGTRAAHENMTLHEVLLEALLNLAGGDCVEDVNHNGILTEF